MGNLRNAERKPHPLLMVNNELLIVKKLSQNYHPAGKKNLRI